MKRRGFLAALVAAPAVPMVKTPAPVKAAPALSPFSQLLSSALRSADLRDSVDFYRSDWGMRPYIEMSKLKADMDYALARNEEWAAK